MYDADGTRKTFTTLGIPEQNRAAERRLGLIAKSAPALSFGGALFLKYQLPEQRRLWKKDQFLTNDDAFNRAETSGNLEKVSP